MFSAFIFFKFRDALSAIIICRKFGQIQCLFFYFVLRSVEIRLPSGLCLTDTAYFSVFCINVSKFGCYGAFVEFTSDQNIRNHLRIIIISAKKIFRGARYSPTAEVFDGRHFSVVIGKYWKRGNPTLNPGFRKICAANAVAPGLPSPKNKTTRNNKKRRKHDTYKCVLFTERALPQRRVAAKPCSRGCRLLARFTSRSTPRVGQKMGLVKGGERGKDGRRVRKS